MKKSLIGHELKETSDIEDDVLLERRRVTEQRRGVTREDVTEQRRDVTHEDETSSSDVLEIVGLTKTFNSLARRTKVVAVDDVTLGIHRGEVIVN